MSNQPTVGIISFPGSNGDHDALYAFEHEIGTPVRSIDYREPDLAGVDAVVLPGGFSYGDALRCGAIARFSPVMSAVRVFAEAGGPVLGICNGFQVLCEAHLLPGALLRNRSLRFHCFWTNVRFEQANTLWTSQLTDGETLCMPVAHGDGAYYADDDVLRRMETNGQIVARYVDSHGNLTEDVNPNGSLGNIAAICNEQRNVVGIMPHPERACNTLTGGADGRRILRSVIDAAVPVH